MLARDLPSAQCNRADGEASLPVGLLPPAAQLTAERGLRPPVHVGSTPGGHMLAQRPNVVNRAVPTEGCITNYT